MPNVLRPRNLVSRLDNMDKTVLHTLEKEDFVLKIMMSILTELVVAVGLLVLVACPA